MKIRMAIFFAMVFIPFAIGLTVGELGEQYINGHLADALIMLAMAAAFFGGLYLVKTLPNEDEKNSGKK